MRLLSMGTARLTEEAAIPRSPNKRILYVPSIPKTTNIMPPRSFLFGVKEKKHIYKERREKMLFMCIYKFEASKRNEIIKRRMEKGGAVLEETKPIGEWIVPGGGKGFILIEAQDTKQMLGPLLAWSDLMQFEITPVMEAEELMKIAGAMK